MTSIHSPARPHDEHGNPQWLQADSILSTIHIDFPEPGKFSVGGWVYHPASRISLPFNKIFLSLGFLDTFLEEWRANPESALKYYFNVDPPIGRREPRAQIDAHRNAQPVKVDAGDLGL